MLLLVCRGVTLRAANPLAAPPPAGTATELEGQLIDMDGRMLKNATVSVVYAPFSGVFLTSPSATSDDLGLFRLSPENDTVPFRVGEIGMFLVTTADGPSYEANAVIEQGPLLVHVPTLLNANVERIENVAVGELAGVVVDEQGKPLQGVLINEGYAHQGHETTTDAKGQFRLKGFERDEKVEVIISKPGYSPETFMQQPTGVGGWVIALGSKTYFEGTVRGPDGQAAAGAKVRANQGPKDGSGFRRSELWTETTTDQQGQYRLYVQPDAYEIAVDAPGFGVAHLDKRPIGYGQVEVLDVELTPGVTFVAHFVDAATGVPVPGVRIRHWQNKKITGTSDAQGDITLTDMLPGRVEIDLKAPGYARWWSNVAMSPWNQEDRSASPN